jgi:hypothetical protein
MHADEIAKSCGCSSRTIERVAKAEPRDLAAARVCPGDERLRMTAPALRAA